MKDFGTLAVTGVVAASPLIMIDVRLVFRTAYATDRRRGDLTQSARLLRAR